MRLKYGSMCDDFIFYIIMYFLINMSYGVFILNRFQKYQSKLFQQYNNDEKPGADYDNR